MLTRISTIICLCCCLSIAGAASNKLEAAFAKLNHETKPLLNKKANAVLPFQVVNKQYFQESEFNQAAKMLLPLAQLGNPKAQIELAFLYEFGHGVKQSYHTAAKWYYLAVRPYNYNYKPLVRALKAYYGMGEAVNYKKAALWFRMSAELSVDKY